ncbi:lck-interacting transmembrane adapter 1 [Indicator indicator]|uniref:lck-interacting transmembrane adapter 1 n=1 Tax=Indicator indicator TaxID=1002788 RepID=UPI0023DE8004|nr:lck-interacting transmembrane adapter 1 [Indicator indicator]
MAVADSKGTLLMPASGALALLGVLIYLGALCAACRRKGRKKKVPPDGVKLVDEALPGQTQLRSLSKSDTKLHELSRVKARDASQCPAGLDLPCPPASGDSISIFLHRELPQIPGPQPLAASSAPEQTYSNLLCTPAQKAVQDIVYECVAMGAEDAPVPPVPTSSQVLHRHAEQGAANYACVRKVKKAVPTEVQDGAVVAPPTALHCWDGARNATLAKLEDMYSTVCKATKKKTQVPTPSSGERGAGWPPLCQDEGALAGCWSPPAAQGTLDPCYESINDRAWTAQGCGPDPDYEAVDLSWRKVVKREPGKDSAPESLYESVGDIWAGEPRRAPARTAASGLEVYITNL